MSEDPQGWRSPGGESAADRDQTPPPPAPQPPPGWGTPPPAAGWGTPPPAPGGWGNAAPPGWGPPPAQQWGWGQPLPPENKPGVIPLRPLAVGEILDGVFSTIRRHARLVLTMSACVAIVQAVLSVLVPGLLGAFTFNFSFGDTTNADTADASVQAFQLLSQGVGTLVTTVLTALLAGAMTVIVSEAVLGRPINGRSVWQRVRPRFWGLLGCSIIVGIVPAIGLLFCLAPGMWLWAAWALATPALVLEGLGPITAIKRSFRLVRGAWWRTFWIRCLAWLISGVVAGVLAVPFAFLGLLITGVSGFSDGAPLGFVFFYALGTALAATVTLPLASGVQALLYVDRRIRAEALDVRLAEAAATTA